MNKSRRSLLGLMLLSPMASTSSVFAAQGGMFRMNDYVFGTTVELSIHGESPERAGMLGMRVMQEFHRLHDKFHAWEPSALTALNEAIARGHAYQVDAEMASVLQAASAIAKTSDNIFNPAIGKLVRTWGFQSGTITPHHPGAAELRSLVDANPRMSDLVFDGTRIASRNKAVMLDLGGYAKGYALDRAASLLRAEGVKAALINVGGNLLAIGRPGNRAWKVGIRNPRGEGVIAALDLHDGEAIGTSGDYQRYFMAGGKRHAHLVAPRTGRNTGDIASVTIITRGGRDAGARSDACTKPLFLAGQKRWQEMADRMQLAEVMLIDTQQNMESTPAMRSRLA